MPPLRVAAALRRKFWRVSLQIVSRPAATGLPGPQAFEALTPQEATCLAQALDEINRGEFFEAHETLELAWAPCRTQNRRFLQAVIHAAVGSHHASRNNVVGMDRQFAKAIHKLHAYQPWHAEIDTALLVATLQDLRRQATSTGAAPRIPLPLIPKTTPASTSHLCQNP